MESCESGKNEKTSEKTVDLDCEEKKANPNEKIVDIASNEKKQQEIPLYISCSNAKGRNTVVMRTESYKDPSDLPPEDVMDNIKEIGFFYFTLKTLILL